MAGIDGSALKNLREKSGASRTQFAEQNEISVQYLCDIEEGRRTLKRNPALVKRFAVSLEVPTFWLQKRDSAGAEEAAPAESATAPKQAKTTAPPTSTKTVSKKPAAKAGK